MIAALKIFAFATVLTALLLGIQALPIPWADFKNVYEFAIGSMKTFDWLVPYAVIIAGLITILGMEAIIIGIKIIKFLARIFKPQM